MCLCGPSERTAQPVREIGTAWGRQFILRALNGGQVLERVGGYGGSNKLFSVERDTLTEEEVLQSLLLIQRSLHPQVGRSRQNTFCER
jgi:sarcosine oxidase delta subunit